MTSNRIDAEFTEKQSDKAQAALASLTKALPFLIDLTAIDRARMLSCQITAEELAEELLDN
jgi:broad specificity phosphatase PhoE